MRPSSATLSLAPAADAAHMLRIPGTRHLDCTAVTGSKNAERVLVVDDDEPLAKSMARILRSRGFDSDVALNGSEARGLHSFPTRRSSDLDRKSVV